eukprot:gene35095-47160_t
MRRRGARCSTRPTPPRSSRALCAKAGRMSAERSTPNCESQVEERSWFRGIVSSRPGSLIQSRRRLAGYRSRTDDVARYLAIIDEADGQFGVVFPDAPGCVAMGGTQEEAIDNAIEALAEWAADEAADGRPIRGPRSYLQILKSGEYPAPGRGGMVATLPLLMESGKVARANVSMDAGLLASIDEAATARGLTRSSFLASAARDKLKGGQRAGEDRQRHRTDQHAQHQHRIDGEADVDTGLGDDQERAGDADRGREQQLQQRKPTCAEATAGTSTRARAAREAASAECAGTVEPGVHHWVVATGVLVVTVGTASGS